MPKRKDDLAAFIRIFKYVRPQWLRVIAVALVVNWATSVNPAHQIKPSDFLLLVVLLGSVAEVIRKVCDVWDNIQTQFIAVSERVF